MNVSSNWCILDENGDILDRFLTDTEAMEATYTGEYPDNCEVAFVNDPEVPDCGNPGPDCIEHNGACD